MPRAARAEAGVAAPAGAGVTASPRPEVRARVREIVARVEIRHARHLADLRAGRPPRREKSIPGWWTPAAAAPPPAQRPEAPR